MKVHVDLGLCRSYALCTGIAPDVFQLDENGVLQVLRAEVGDDRRAEMEEAAMMCPTQAISLIEG